MLRFNTLTTTPNVTQIVVPSDVGRTTLDHIENVFLEFAGGFTVTAGRGGWRDDAGANILEPVMVYSIANLPRSAVETIANVLLYDAKPVQTTVYVVLPDGRAGLYGRPTGIDANDPGAVARAVANAEPVFQNGISPGSDYPDQAWLADGRKGELTPHEEAWYAQHDGNPCAYCGAVYVPPDDELIKKAVVRGELDALNRQVERVKKLADVYDTLEPNRTFDHKVVTKENSSEFVAEVERRLKDGRRGKISSVYNTPDAYKGTLS